MFRNMKIGMSYRQRYMQFSILQEAFIEYHTNKCNHQSFQPVSNAHSNLCDNYLEPYILHDTIDWKLPLVIPDKIKSKLAKVHLKARKMLNFIAACVK